MRKWCRSKEHGSSCVSPCPAAPSEVPLENVAIQAEMQAVVDVFVTEILQIAKKTAVDALKSAFAVEDFSNVLSSYPPDTRFSLRVESLESTMKMLSFSTDHIKFWRDIPKVVKVAGKTYRQLPWHDEITV